MLKTLRLADKLRANADCNGGGWFLILDSDDWLPERGLEVSARYITQIEDDGRFAGVAGLNGTDENTLLWIRGTSPDNLTAKGRRTLEREYVDSTSKEYRYKLRIPGDRAEVVRTALMRSHPFPVFEGNRFMSEGLLWQALSDEGYLFRWFNEITYCGDYLDDGLSKNAGTAYADSPRGTAYLKNSMLGSKIPLVRTSARGRELHPLWPCRWRECQALVLHMQEEVTVPACSTDSAGTAGENEIGECLGD
ncbi:MAG: hypothetical protein ACFWTL_06240 [Atopobium sp.]